jgi:branched-chain amino acid transport system substrate-binding protein
VTAEKPGEAGLTDLITVGVVTSPNDVPLPREPSPLREARASQEGTDALGFYLPPFAYAYVQILGQAIEATKSLDQAAVGEYIRAKEFETVVGKVRFGPNGEWAQARILQVQFQGIQSKETSEFAKSGKMVVLDPPEYKSGDIVYPFRGWQ